MQQITLDENVARQFRAAESPTQLCDPSGKILGEFVPRFDPSQWEIGGPALTDEEFQRMAQSTGKTLTADEVTARLRRLRN